MRLVLLLITVLFVFPASSETPQRTKKTHTPEQETANDSQRMPSIRSLNKIEPPAQKDQTDSYDARSDRLYRWYLRATIIGVAGGFIGIGLLIWQSILLRQTANAAKQSADAVMSAERSWIMARIERAPGYGPAALGTRQDGTEDTSLVIRLITRNDGKTPAWILEKRAIYTICGLHDRLPDAPNIASMEIVQPHPEPVGVRDVTFVEHTLTAIGRQGFDHAGYVYGWVKYRDAFGEHETLFGYRVTLAYDYERLSGYPEYNKNT